MDERVSSGSASEEKFDLLRMCVFERNWTLFRIPYRQRSRYLEMVRTIVVGTFKTDICSGEIW